MVGRRRTRSRRGNRRRRRLDYVRRTLQRGMSRRWRGCGGLCFSLRTYGW